MKTDYDRARYFNNGPTTIKSFDDIFGTFGPGKGLEIFVITANLFPDDGRRVHYKSLHRYRPATEICRLCRYMQLLDTFPRKKV